MKYSCLRYSCPRWSFYSLLKSLSGMSSMGTHSMYMRDLSICFCWTSIVGASYGFRYKREYGDGHVRFSILSDLLKGKANLWLQVLLSALTVVGMAILFVPSCHTVSAYSISKTTIMHIPFSYIYFPFLIFLVLTAVHEVYSIVVNLRKIFGNTNGLADPASEKSDNWEG